MCKYVCVYMYGVYQKVPFRKLGYFLNRLIVEREEVKVNFCAHKWQRKHFKDIAGVSRVDYFHPCQQPGVSSFGLWIFNFLRASGGTES